MVDYIKIQLSQQMIKTFLSGITTVFRKTITLNTHTRLLPSLIYRPLSAFCSNNPISTSTLTPSAHDIKVSTATVGQQEVEMVQTTGAISIMDRVPGVKAENGELYVLSFTCTKCETKSIRSFTKHAYHKGVVLVRCGGCENIHLVADNIGWFDDKPINIETMHKGKVTRVQDPIVIGKFLETAFKQEEGKQVL